VLEKLESIELSEELAGGNWRSTQTYIEIISRRLRETVALGAPGEDNRT